MLMESTVIFVHDLTLTYYFFTKSTSCLYDPFLRSTTLLPAIPAAYQEGYEAELI